MGRRGYVQTRHPEYGDCVTDWAQRAFYNYLEKRTRLVVDTDNEFAPEGADHWDIRIPERFVGRGSGRKLVVEYDYVLEVAKRLREKPGLIRDEDGEGPYGDQCADVLEQGVKAAKRQRIRTITIDWF